MPKTVREVLVMPRGFRTREAALEVARLEELTDRLRADLRGIGAAELAWQPAPGMNTIGMLLAHLALVEVWWCVGVMEEQGPDTPFQRLVRLGPDDDGMPLAAGARPPAGLAGRPLAWFLRALGRGRAEVWRVAAALRESDLDRPRTRRYRDGHRSQFDARWVLHHLVEHFSGHYGQILMLRHLHRARRVRVTRRATPPAARARRRTSRAPR